MARLKSMLTPRHSRKGKVASLIASVLLILGAGWFIINRDYAYDLYNYWQYKPTEQIAALSERAGLSDKGKFYLYTSHATINTASEFNLNCERREDKNAILGCYNAGRIYIYDVNSSELDGIKEVTAAHEMLHAAWLRLSSGEQERIAGLLEKAYQANTTDELKERMDYYSRNEAGERTNELHSIIGTEVKDLDSELDAYYSQFFTDRQKVVALFEKYNSVFVRLSNEAEGLYKELTTLESNIEILKKAYEAEAKALQSDITEYNRKLENGSYGSATEAEQVRRSLLVRIDESEAVYQQIRSQIASYNQKYDKYQQLMVRSASLSTAVDSTLIPAPSL